MSFGTLRADTLTECEKIAQCLFRDDVEIRAVEQREQFCEVAFKDSNIETEVESMVECDDRCLSKGDYETEEYNECVESCNDAVQSSVVGSILVDKDLSIREATIPVSCVHVLGTDEIPREVSVLKDFGGRQPEPESPEAKLLRRLRMLGCKKSEIGWRHAHEFMPNPVEWEEEPAFCYVHVEAQESGMCNAKQVLPLLR